MLKLRDGTAVFQNEHYINCSIDAVFVLCLYMPQCCPIGFKIIDNSIILTVTSFHYRMWTALNKTLEGIIMTCSF